MGVYDQCARYAIQADPLGFFHWLLPGLDPTLGFRGWLDTRTLPFPGEPDRTCDTVAALAGAGQADPLWALVVEFQAEPQADMLDRLLEYVARLRRELRHGPQRRAKYQVVAAVVNLTGPIQSDTLEMLLPPPSPVGLRMRAAVRAMGEEDAARTLAGIAAGRIARGLLSWIPLMQGAAESPIMEQWQHLAGAEPDRRWRAMYGALALVFAELSGVVAPWREVLEGWNMRESTVVAEWKAEGKAEGRAEGKAEGKAEGQVEARRSDLLRVLQLRFQTPVPANLVAVVKAETDLAQLARWLDAAVLAASIDEFQATVQP